MTRKTASAAPSPLERAFGALVKAFTTFVKGPGQPAYNPARHYMRGPGPKWAARHGMARAGELHPQSKREG